MPGPRNSKKAKKRQNGKDRKRSQRDALKEIERNTATVQYNQDTMKPPAEGYPTEADKTAISGAHGSPMHLHNQDDHTIEHGQLDGHPTGPPNNPFIVDPGNGPRVRNMDAFLSAFFCPPISMDDADCELFSRGEIVSVLESVLPREVALIVWFNKTRSYERICPACQRIYRVGDVIVDPISGESIDTADPRTPPHVLREQHLSGFCSFPCFFLASYSSHPYSAEVAQGTWGLRSEELDPQVRSLVDTTDPRTAAILRFGLAACTPSLLEGADMRDDQGLGRVLRLTRRKDLGFGEVLEALAWHEKGRGNGQAGLQ